jgi:CheY-like chemotaxis protein
VEPGLQSLLLCTDDKVVRVLRRVLSEMEIAVEHCSSTDAAVQKLTRQRFEAVIVDCTTPQIASTMLRGTRSSPVNKRAIVVAVLEADTASESQAALKDAFALGAHFVLFKPISLERTRSSFRAVRALMKRERRRHARIPIQVPVELKFDGGLGTLQATTSDLGENGMAVRLKDRRLQTSFQLGFTLPGTFVQIECRGEVAWEGNHIIGIRFCDLSAGSAEELKQWIGRQLMGSDADEPPVNCKLTDLSLGACYLQTESPFPVRTRLLLMMKVSNLSLQIEGIVRVMHPGSGMGVEFTRHTPSQRARVEEFIDTLVNSTGAVPDLQVRPDAIDNSSDAYSSWQLSGERGDPLLSLFRAKTDLPPDLFYAELRKQRGASAEVGV